MEVSMATNDRDQEIGAPGVSRRQFLHGVAAAAGACAFGGLGRVPAVFASPVLPPPEASGIEHIVVLMMENRSFDHFLGWLGGADGRQRGLRYLDRNGDPHVTHRLTPDFQGCGHPDPDHSYAGGRAEFNNGACDGWLRAGNNDEYSIGYYTRRDLPFFAGAAPRWTVCDRYFASIMAETFPNRMYQHAAQTDRLSNSFDLSTLPTIWDRLADAGLDGRYYFSDVPLLALWGFKYLPIARLFGSFLEDAAAGTLPHVAFVEPRFMGETEGTSNDDHPFADVRSGEAFLNLVYNAVTTSPAWPQTLLVITYDEWGGFFDHVPPPTAPIPDADRIAGNEDGRLGFRTPSLVISPFARSHVSSLELDHTSILRAIEWRWGLPSLTVRDQTANNLAEVLDFRKPDLTARAFNVPVGPFGGACQPSAAAIAAAPNKWAQLRQMAADFGWPV
jgi:phospholipase C